MLNGWYNLIGAILPFAWANHFFMKNALLAILLVTPLFGLLGTMVVSNRMAFFSDSLGHGAFTGIAIGAVIGLVQPIAAATVFSVIFAVVITLIKNKSRVSTDTVIGVFSSTAVALGLVILSFSGSFNQYSAYLVGDILSIEPVEIILLIFVFVAIVVMWVLLFNRVLLISINQSLAASRGIRTLVTEMLFTAAIAVIVTITIQWVGLLIINSLLVLPAAAARNITSNARQYTLTSVGFSLFSGLTGLILSYYTNTATGAAIVLISAVLFFITFALRRRFST
jgi:zinc transport system permease protein